MPTRSKQKRLAVECAPVMHTQRCPAAGMKRLHARNIAVEVKPRHNFKLASHSLARLCSR